MVRPSLCRPNKRRLTRPARARVQALGSGKSKLTNLYLHGAALQGLVGAIHQNTPDTKRKGDKSQPGPTLRQQGRRLQRWLRLYHNHRSIYLTCRNPSHFSPPRVVPQRHGNLLCYGPQPRSLPHNMLQCNATMLQCIATCYAAHSMHSMPLRGRARRDDDGGRGASEGWGGSEREGRLSG